MREKRKFVILTFLFCFFFVALSVCLHRRASAEEMTLQKILRERKFNIGYVVLPPTVIKDPKTGALSGHFMESANFICSEMKVEPVYQETQFATFIAGLQTKKFDMCILPAMGLITRAMAIDFTHPLFYNGDRFSQRKGEKRFKSIGDINKKGVNIAVLQGGSTYDWSKTYLPNASLVVVPGGDLVGVFVQLSMGHVDLPFGNAVTAKTYEKTHPELEPALRGKIMNMAGCSWTVRRGEQDLLNFLNVAIDYIKTTGRLETWEKQYGAEWFHEKIEIE